MAGYNLKEGQFENRQISDDELWSVFNYAFSSQIKHDTSYKYGFLKSLMDNLYNVDENLTLSFDQIFSKFAEIYWNLVLKYGIRQKAVTKGKNGSVLETELHKTVEQYHIAEGVLFESLEADMMVDLCHRVKKGCKQNVVGAFYEDTKNLFYSFSKTGEWLQFNPRMYEFVCKHKVAIEKMNYYEWARFLERVNDDSVMDHLLTKIEESSLRNNLSVYRKILFEEFESKKCFYCGRKLVQGKIHVDHFIPWSFVKDDNLWNFVLTCPACNLSKNDKLPDIIFVDKITDRNNEIVLTNRVKNEMKTYSSTKLKAIYDWAKSNGYNSIWRPKERKDENEDTQ